MPVPRFADPLLPARVSALVGCGDEAGGIARRLVERLATVEREVLLSSFRHGAGLTAREIEVLKGVAEGLSDKEVALKLFLSEPTVKSHLRSVYQKLKIHNRAQAAAYAVKNGLAE